MLGNIKEFISVVQDGLTSNNNLRQTLQEVHRMSNIFRDKQKMMSESQVNFGAGGALLEKYQDEWARIHENAEQSAKAADDVDKLILELHDVTKSRLQSANEMAQNLALIPGLTASVAQCMDNIRNIQSQLRTVEAQLVEFEDIVERSKMESWKLDHHYHLTMYKDKKMVALEDVRNKLVKENTQQNQERERRQLAELQAKREQSASAFQQDVAKYLAGENLPTGQPSKPNVTLEQIQLDDDRAALDDFLNS